MLFVCPIINLPYNRPVESRTNITVLYLTVSEESSYSSDNTEPEDDCRGCQLQ